MYDVTSLFWRQSKMREIWAKRSQNCFHFILKSIRNKRYFMEVWIFDKNLSYLRTHHLNCLHFCKNGRIFLRKWVNFENWSSMKYLLFCMDFSHMVERIFANGSWHINYRFFYVHCTFCLTYLFKIEIYLMV